MRKTPFILFIITIILTGCSKDGFIDDITAQTDFREIITNPCFYGIGGSEFDEIVINDNESYQDFGDSIRIYPINLDCDTASLPYIDFNNYTLVGKSTLGGGCGAVYVRKMFKDNSNKIIVYEIDVEYIGNCYMSISNRNWSIIPKLSKDYEVVFRVSQKYN